MPPLPPVSLPTIATKIGALPEAQKAKSGAVGGASSAEENALIDNDELCSGEERRAYDTSMRKLKKYFNGEKGAKSDHLFTTRKAPKAYKLEVCKRLFAVCRL